MSAQVTQRGSRKFQAWCPACADGLNTTTRVEANTWEALHNAKRHTTRGEKK